MNPFATTTDPAWHRVIDSLVILAIGVAVGVMVGLIFIPSETITVTKVIQRVPLKSQDDSQGTVKAPVQSDTPKFEES